MLAASPPRGVRSRRQQTDRSGLILAAATLISLICVLAGWASPPPADGGSAGAALLRVALAAILSGTLLLGPGLLLRRLAGRFARLPLGFVPLPGAALLVLAGLIVWASARALDPHTVSRLLLSVMLLAILLATSRGGQPLAEPGEARTLLVAGTVFVVALGRSLWSPGPNGELYGGTISRTLEVGDRSDSRISYHVSSLIAHGAGPYSTLAHSMFAPWSFADRGPLAGLTAAPVMLATGATPADGLPSQPWEVFDAQGFMAYRVVMMMLALTSLLAVYTITRHVSGERVAALAVVICAGTPFYLHDVYFTWPKFAAAALCLLSAYCVLINRPGAAGLLLGIGYLTHPLALLSVPGILLIAAFATNRSAPARQRIPAAARSVGWLALGLGVVALGWRLINGSHYSQGRFLNYLRQGDNVMPVSFGTWLRARWDSLLNTFLPLRLPLADPHNRAINVVGGSSDGLIHFFFQYWTSLTFGAGIVFYPFLLIGLGVMFRRRPGMVIITCVVPLLAFAIYWGSATSGLLREGLHVWVLTIMIIWSMQFTRRLDHDRALPPLLRIVLQLRLVEVLLMMTVPSVAYHHSLLGAGHRGTDLVALALMLLGLATLGWLTAQHNQRPSAHSQQRRPAPAH